MFLDDTTHYVVLGYALTINIDLANLPQEQYKQYAWFTANDMLRREDVHRHSKWYVPVIFSSQGEFSV
jgi:colanic acid biosynthesis protein WcaH